MIYMNMNKRPVEINIFPFFPFWFSFLYSYSALSGEYNIPLVFLIMEILVFLCLYIYFLLVSGLSCFSNCNEAPCQESLSPTRYS